LLARGWVAATAGDRVSGEIDASSAAAVSRCRGDELGLAEALLLGALCTTEVAYRDRALAEAIDIWQGAGCRVAEAIARLVATRLGAGPDRGVAHALETLRALEVELAAPRPAGALAVIADTTPAVAIRALGVFQVIRDGVPVPRTAWQSRKARQLLKIVVARRRPVPREQLMELLWPEADPARLGNRLSVQLSAVRDVLQSGGGPPDAGPLVTDGSGVWLDHALVEVDVERFLEQAAAALEAHRHDRPDALIRLTAAEVAHTGEFMEDDPYEPWAAAPAEEVRATHIALLRALVQRLRRSGAVDEQVRYTLRLLEKDAYDEPAHLDLVGLLVGAGRHGEARRRYDLYVRAMSDFGIVPQPFHVDGRLRGRRRR
ncbi:MAG TPA: BTAD domain-containing putative transcriptional regulator, partial [Pseudonocardiaceae bacterium]